MPARPSTLAAVIERGFTEGVADRLARGPLTFTDRTTLLLRGQQLGIDRFRGNLIIADQQDRLTRRSKGPRPAAGLLLPIAAFAVVQAAVAAFTVWMLWA